MRSRWIALIATIYIGGYLQEVARVCSRHVGHTANLALAPQQAVVVEFRDAVAVDRIDRDDLYRRLSAGSRARLLASCWPHCEFGARPTTGCRSRISECGRGGSH